MDVLAQTLEVPCGSRRPITFGVALMHVVRPGQCLPPVKWKSVDKPLLRVLSQVLVSPSCSTAGCFLNT